MVCAAAPVAAVWLAGAAGADPAGRYAALTAASICGYLDAYPTLPGVDAVLAGVARDTGFGAHDVARVVVSAVTGACPWHADLLRRWSTTYTPEEVTV